MESSRPRPWPRGASRPAGVSLALASEAKSLALVLALNLKSLIRCLQVSRRLKNNRHHTNGPSPHCFLHMNAAATATALNVRQHAKFLYQPLWNPTWILSDSSPSLALQIHGKLSCRKPALVSCTTCWRKLSARQQHQHPWNVSSVGLFMRPHRARMGDKMLADLVFLKCNKHI